MNNKSGPSIPKDIRRALDKSKKIVQEYDQDRVYIITGNEGSGKSVLAMQLGYYLDNNLSIENICFTGDEFATRLREKEKGGVIIFDEAFNGLSSKGAISIQNKKLIRLLQECRQRNLFIFIVLPSVFLLEKYVSLFRSHGLFHTKIFRRNAAKRYFQVYNRKNKKELFLKGQKMMSYSYPKLFKKYNFYGKFPPTIPKKDYLKKKEISFRDDGEKKNPREYKWRLQRDVLIDKCKKELGITYVQISKWFKTYNCPMDDSSMGRLSPQNPENPPRLSASIL